MERNNDLNRLTGERTKEIAQQASMKADQNDASIVAMDLIVNELNETVIAQKTELIAIKELETGLETSVSKLNSQRTSDLQNSHEQLQEIRSKVR